MAIMRQIGRFETKDQRPITGRHFAGRLARHAAAGTIVVLFSLLLGIVGYVAFEGLSVVDAFLNAAMLLGGMGPVNLPQHFAGKVFAGLYALYAGLVLILVAGLMLAPVVHRVLHRFHWDENQT